MSIKTFKQFVNEKKKRKRPSCPSCKPRRNIEDYDQEFIKWIGTKLQKKIGKFIGMGVDGMVYELDKHRVIKFTQYHRGSKFNAFLQNKTLPGVYKIYSTGIIHLPERFWFIWDPNSHIYGDGLELDKYNDDDHQLAYIIMERVYPSKQLTKQINKIDYSVNGANGLKQIQSAVKDNDNKKLNEFKKYFKDKNEDDLASLIDEIAEVYKTLNKHDIKWSDNHGGNWARNKNGKLVAIDLDDDGNVFNGGSNKQSIPKNVIRERSKL